MLRYRRGAVACASIACLCLSLAAGAQRAPAASEPLIPKPAYGLNAGPIIAMDEAHKNTHNYSSQLQGLVRVLQRDGYRVRPITDTISRDSLTDVGILVIAQPGGWDGPQASLNDAEVSALLQWVRAGGALLLILDHMPAPLNAARLVQALGVRAWHDGYAMVEVPDALPVGRISFRRHDYIVAGEPAVIHTGPAGMDAVLTYQGADAVLSGHRIADGRGPDERVRGVLTFVGSAFQGPPGAEPLLVLPDRAASLMPDKPSADVRVGNPKRAPVGGWLQGAVLEFGKGRVALFGEVGMFSGQWPVHPAAEGNYRFALNVMHWLSRVLP